MESSIWNFHFAFLEYIPDYISHFQTSFRKIWKAARFYNRADAEKFIENFDLMIFTFLHPLFSVLSIWCQKTIEIPSNPLFRAMRSMNSPHIWLTLIPGIKRNMCLMKYGVEVIMQDRINIFDYANVMDWNVGFYEDSNYWRHLFKDVGGDLGRCSAGKLATDSVMGAPEGHLPFVFLCIFRWTTFLYPPFFLPLTLRLLLLGFFLGEILPLSLL